MTHWFRVFFRKDAGARFLSHLDLAATIEYSVRRARLPVELSEGYNPRPRISLAAALSVGYVGEREIIDLALREPLPPAEIAKRLQSSVPAGITILEAVTLPPKEKRAAAQLAAAVYRVELAEPADDLADRVADLLRRTSLPWEEEREAQRVPQRRVRDVRPLLRALEAIGDRTLRLHAQMDGEGTLRPEIVLALMGLSADGARFVREQVLLRG